MKTNTRTNKLQKSSGLFFQLGLLLTLFTVYIAVEHKTELFISDGTNYEPEPYKEYAFHQYEEYKVEETKTQKKIKTVEKKTILNKPKVVDNNDKKEEYKPPFDEVDNSKETNVDITAKLVNVKEEEELEPDFFSVQEKPIYPGCEKVKENERRACFEKKITKHVSRKFNADLAQTLGLPSGKKRIYVEFIISKTGDIEITNARAVHKKLVKEGKRVVNKLPKMIPGKQNGKEVNVKYILPITFNVE